jgi:hypothetical protein
MTATMRCWLAMASVFVLPSTVVAEPPTQPPAQTQSQPNLPEQKIDNVALAILIKSAIVAVQHANSTGNYSVLRDLGTPGFRERFDQAKLTAIFASFRARGINLSPVLMLLPNLTKPAEMTPQGQLRVFGTFPTRPLQIQYALVFQQQDGAWRLDGIAVDAVAANDGPASTAQAAARSVTAAGQDPRKSKPAPASKKAEPGIDR